MAFSEFDELSFKVDAIKLQSEYAECGSHVLETTITATRSEFKALQERLSKILKEKK